jgi:hypothetical protein
METTEGLEQPTSDVLATCLRFRPDVNGTLESQRAGVPAFWLLRGLL